jgi:uncharacterized protein YkwD
MVVCMVALLWWLALPAAASGHGKRRARPVRHVVVRAGVRRVCAGVNLIPRAGDLAAVAAATRCLVNRERVRHDRPPLVDNAPLDRVASAHSREMVRRDYFGHVSQSGSTAARRILRSGRATAADYAGHRHRLRLAENLATAGGYLATPARIVASWMRSPLHRANILDPGLRASGIGVAPGMPARSAHGWRGLAGTYTEDFLGT